MAAAYHPAGRKRWLAARGGHARGETARAGAAEQHDGQAPATAAAATQFPCGPLAAGRGNSKNGESSVDGMLSRSQRGSRGRREHVRPDESQAKRAGIAAR